ncbi:unnamed protein product [Linum trigynum]|uniref:glutathione transferase n=1 Tax=Linum trigynum TaxID=586398 RepID=A0AAV2EMG5_9ROSI
MATFPLNGSSVSASNTALSLNLKPSSHQKPSVLVPTTIIPSRRRRSLLPALGLNNDLGNKFRRDRVSHITSATMAAGVGEILPPPLTSASNLPAIFDGTSRLYLSYTCPYAQRVWITRNCKGLQEEIKLVPLDLKDRPSWYKEKVYPPNKVPALEHNNEVIGESLDLMKYIDAQFHGPQLLPQDPARREFAEELFSNAGSFHKAVSSTLKGEGAEAVTEAAFDDIEAALSKFDDGPFFLCQFSLADIAYAPFMERYQPVLLDMRNYDITAKRPKLATWIQEMSKIEGYNQTRRNPKEHVENYKKRFAGKVQV